MANFEFVIPVTRDLLKTSSNTNHYHVQQVFTSRLIPAELLDCESFFRSHGSTGIVKKFDVFYSIICQFNELNQSIKEDAWDILLQSLRTLASEISVLLEEESSDDLTNRRPIFLNSVKMICYLVCQFIQVAHEESHGTVTNAAVAKGRKKSMASVSKSGNWDFEQSIAVFIQLISIGLHRLWNPPIVEEDFIDLIANTCYNILEQATNAKDKSLRENIFHLLGILVKRYNHGLTCVLRFMQLLQHSESLVTPLAQAMHIFASKFGMKSLIGDIMREIGSMDIHGLAKDTSSARAYSTFLKELSESSAMYMLPFISVLLPLLDEESYSMRCSVISILGDLVINCCNNEQQSESMRSSRDQFIDKIEDHIHDVNSFVRGRSLGVFLKIVNEKALPLPRYSGLLDLVIGRVMDKSAIVRKNAVILLSALLQSNPFAGTLNAEELHQSYEKENEILMKMKQTDEDSHKDLYKEVENKWEQMSASVMESIATVTDDSAEDSNTEPFEEGDGTEIIIQDIVSKINKGNYKKATLILMEARKLWPDKFSFRHDKSGESEEIETENINEDLLEALKSLYIQTSIASKLSELESNISPNSDRLTTLTEINKQKVLVSFLKDSTFFVKAIQGAVSVVCQLLGSKTLSDVLEAVDFFVIAHEFNVAESSLGIHQMLSLIWSKEASVKDAILSAYRRIYLIPASTGNARNRALTIANSLVTLASSATMGELTSLEELIREFVKSGDINSAVIQILWEKFSAKLPLNHDQNYEEKAKESRTALQLLGMAASANVDIVSSNINVLVKVGLGDRAEQDFLLTKETCSALLKLATKKKPKGTLVEAPLKFPADHEIFERLTFLLISGVSKIEDYFWIPMTEAAVNLIYQLSESPDLICGKLIKEIVKILVEIKSQQSKSESDSDTLGASKCQSNDNEEVPSSPSANQTQSQGVDKPQTETSQAGSCEDQQENKKQPTEGERADVSPEIFLRETQSQTQSQTQSSSGYGSSQEFQSSGGSDQSNKKSFYCPSPILTRLLFLAGHVAFRQLIHLEVSILDELKRRNQIRDSQNNKDGRKSILKEASTTTPMATPSEDKKKKNKRQKDKKQSSVEEEEDMGLQGAVADDAEAEFIRQITENEIVTGDNLLALLRPLIVAVCSHQQEYSDKDLQSAAGLSLAKYMLVSSEFCEDHLQLLFTILERSPHPEIRGNTIIALGDLTYRFPNLIEPWTSHIYSRLKDDVPSVRKNTLMVLTHLILNDMVKVKGQISELATCVIDDDNFISGLAKLFFHELAKKGNAVYNIMPDVISRLSDPEIGVAEENFRTIMKYLFSFIQKDRQCESLVEKLCHRFRSARNERQWRDIGFCLSLLSYSEKSLQKLMENITCYADKLYEDDLYSSFVTILSNARKFPKTESKAIIDELEVKIEEFHVKGLEEEDVSNKASKAAAEARSRRKTPRKSPLGKSTRKEKCSQDEFGSPSSKPKSRARKAVPLIFSSSEDENSFQSPPKRAQKSKRRGCSDDASEEKDETVKEPDGSPDPASPVNLAASSPGKKTVDSSPACTTDCQPSKRTVLKEKNACSKSFVKLYRLDPPPVNAQPPLEETPLSRSGYGRRIKPTSSKKN